MRFQFIIYMSLLIVTLPLMAQERQVNNPDHASPTLGNSTTESETSHAVHDDTVVAGWNEHKSVRDIRFSRTDEHQRVWLFTQCWPNLDGRRAASRSSRNGVVGGPGRGC